MKIRDETGGNFTVIHNTILQDPSISYKAKGLFVDMLSLPDDWVFTVRGMVKRSTDGRDSITSALKELEDAGYIRRKQNRENGKFSANEYVIIETPSMGEPSTGNPSAEKSETITPLAGNPCTDKPTLLNTNILSTIDNQIPIDKIPPLSPNGGNAPAAAEKKREKGNRAKLNEIIADQPEELQEPLREFVKMRSGMKKPLTAHALELNIKKLYGLSSDPKERVDIVEQSIMRSYQGFFPVKNDNVNSTYSNKDAANERTSNPFLNYARKEGLL